MALVCSIMLACAGEGKKTEGPVSESETPKKENPPNQENDIIAPIESSVDDMNQKTDDLSNDLDSLINEI